MSNLFLLHNINQAITQAVSANQRLSEIIAGQNAQQLAQEQLSQRLDGLLHFRSQLKQVLQIAEENPVHAFWYMVDFHQWCQQSGVSSTAFQQVSDKEVFLECTSLAAEIQAIAAPRLSSEQKETLKHTSKALVILPAVRMYLTWRHIYDKMRKCGWLPAFYIWNGGGILYVIFFALLFLPVAMGFLLGGILKLIGVSEGLVGLTLFLLIVFLPIATVVSYISRSRLASRLHRLAQSVGGSITSRTRIKDLKGFPEGLRADLGQHGVPVERMSDAELMEYYQKEAKQLRASNEAYNLDIALADYPLTIPLD